MHAHILLALLFVVLISPAASAQWLKLPSEGIPRMADGRPDLAAPAVRTADGRPDFSGIWTWDAGPYMFNVARDLAPEDIQPAARALVASRAEHHGKDDPGVRCLPQGPRRNKSPFLPVKIVQTPRLIVMLSEDLTYRQIFLDGRTLPEDPSPSFMGYSVGRWEGDTLVVETIGFKDRTWLDHGGSPHSESLRVVERFTRPVFGRIEVEETLQDPENYRRPWTVRVRAHLQADTELLEYVCNENERSRPHLVGTVSDDERNAVPVAAEILAKYVGTYELRLPTGTAVRFTVTMAGERLFMDGRRLIPFSETTFGGAVQLRVVTDERGYATHLFINAVEGEAPAVRVADGK